MKLSLKMTLAAAAVIIAVVFICFFFIISFTEQNMTASAIETGLADHDIFRNTLIEAAEQNITKNETVRRSFLKKSLYDRYGAHEYVLQQGTDYITNNTGLDPVAVLEQKGVKMTDDDRVYALASVRDGEYLIISEKITLWGEEYTLSLVRGITETMNGLFQLVAKCAAVCGIVTVSAVFLMIFLIRRSLRPVKKLADGAERFASGEYSFRLEEKGKDELSGLARSFNGMAAAIEKHIADIKATSDERKMLLAALSHEMKTPITAITGYAHALTFAKLSEQQKSEAIYFIDSECRRLERLSGKLMQLISLNGEKPVPEKTQITNIVREIKPILQTIAEKNGITLTFGTDDAVIKTDRELMSCLITNLFDNAKKAGAKNIKISLKSDKVSVTDDGCGIPEEEIKKITQPFYVLDKSRNTGGFGLGLAIAHRIAELHGTEITIKSEKGRGTVVSMRI